MYRWFILVLIVITLAGSITAVVFMLQPSSEPSEDEYSRYPHYPFYVSISADGSHIVARYRGSNGFVQLFSKAENTPLWTWESPISYPDSSSISADGSYITVGADRLYLFTKDNKEPIWSHSGAVIAVISADGNYIAAADILGLNKLYLFRRIDNTPVWSRDGSASSVSISSDGSYIIADDSLFSKTDNMPLRSYSGGVSSMSENGDYMAGHGDWSVYVFRKDNSSPLWSYNFGTTVRRSAISADGNYIAAIASQYIYHQDSTGDLREYLYLFSRENAGPLWSSTTDFITEAGTGPKTLLAISSDGNYIAAGTHRKLHLFNRADNTPLWSREFSGQEEAHSVAMSSDGNYIVVGTKGGPAPNIGGSVYLFDNDGNIVWSYFHEVEPYH